MEAALKLDPLKTFHHLRREMEAEEQAEMKAEEQAKMKAEEQAAAAAAVGAAAVTAAVMAAAMMEMTEMVPVKIAARTGVEPGGDPADRRCETVNARSTFQPRPVLKQERNDGLGISNRRESE